MPDFVVKRIRTIEEIATVSGSDEDSAEERSYDIDGDSWVCQNEHIQINSVLPAVYHEKERDFGDE